MARFDIFPAGCWNGSWWTAPTLSGALAEMEDAFGPLPPQAEVWHHWKSGNQWWMPIYRENRQCIGRICLDDGLPVVV